MSENLRSYNPGTWTDRGNLANWGVGVDFSFRGERTSASGAHFGPRNGATLVRFFEPFFLCPEKTTPSSSPPVDKNPRQIRMAQSAWLATRHRRRYFLEVAQEMPDELVQSHTPNLAQYSPTTSCTRTAVGRARHHSWETLHFAVATTAPGQVGRMCAHNWHKSRRLQQQHPCTQQLSQHGRCMQPAVGRALAVGEHFACSR